MSVIKHGQTLLKENLVELDLNVNILLKLKFANQKAHDKHNQVPKKNLKKKKETYRAVFFFFTN